jgi:outer membrane protein OmpU
MYKLLATSALVAAGLWGTTDAAFAQAKVAPISVVVGGYMEQTFGYARNKNNVNYGTNGGGLGAPTNKPNRFSQQSDAEIFFGGRTTLANGITIGFDVQLEANTSTDQIDESYLFIDGAFGRLVIGSENAADYIMNYSIPGVGRSFGALESAALSYIVRPTNVTILDTVQSGKASGGGGNAFPATGNDQQRVTYFTPRFFGFQGGLSYTPNVNLEDTNGFADKLDNRANAWHGAVNFTNTFGGFRLNAMAGMSYYPKISGAASTTVGGQSIKDISAGLQVGFGGFLVGGGYRNLDNKNAAEDGYAWGLGATWTGGPFAIGANYLTSKVEGASAGVAADDKFRQIMLSAAYTMGPGVDLIGSVFHIKYTDEGGANADKNSGVGVVTGIRLTF